jgi:2-polyprenyl-3-methyl-5-hydroxy-6-metoxy-1,4-benzoquinol methylase
MSLRRRIAARVPFVLSNELIYPRSYFERVEEEQRELYARLADALHDHWSPESVLDVGCGTGQILAHLAEKGVRISGVDGSRQAIENSPVRNWITRWNLRHPLPDMGTYDLVICTEVAEHLPPSSARTLVASLTSHGEVVLFTAATPGQGGRHHLNEQPHEFWEHLFREHGFERSATDEAYLQDQIAAIQRAKYIPDNLMIFLSSEV